MELFSHKVIQPQEFPPLLERTNPTIKGTQPPPDTGPGRGSQHPVQCLQSTTVSDNTFHLLLFKLRLQAILAREAVFRLAGPSAKGKGGIFKTLFQLVLNKIIPAYPSPESGLLV